MEKNASLRHVWKECLRTYVLEKWGLNVPSSLLEKSGMSIYSSLLEQDHMSINENVLQCSCKAWLLSL